MRLAFRAVFLGMIVTALLTTSYAWDDVGHKTTAYIAWQRMSPEARENVIRILRTAPEDSHLSAFYMQYGPEPDHIKKLEYFMLVATWADIIRDRAFENRQKKYHKSNWHYDDTFWRQVAGKAVPLSGFEEGGVAVSKLSEFDKVIRDAGASDKEKAIAIAWIMHLAGDLHQPLHTSARVTDTEPKGDQGGNLFLLTPEGTPRDKQVNLHWFWDSIIGRNIPLKGEMCERDYIVAVAKGIMKKHPYTSFGSAMNIGEYRSWQQQSFQLNPTNVFSPDLVRFQMPSEKYKRNAFRVAERQLALAGYRLGETLNRVFAKTVVTGQGARPAIMTEVNGKLTARVFDVMTPFVNEEAARKYPAANAITDISFDIQ
ncbi:MAG TPA: S1/P1 nuclease [Pyrinomonadaceae bacterium]